jgi:two-component system, chemotaxis family, CheB/CheR fusion protein
VEAKVSQPDESFEPLLLFLKENRGFEFTSYKRSNLTRRVNHRMAKVRASDYSEYLDYLEVHTEEFTALFNTILINVTSFSGTPRHGISAQVDSAPDAGGQGAG